MSMPDLTPAVLVPALACPAWCMGRHDEFPGTHDSAPFGDVWLTRADLLTVTRDGHLSVTAGEVCVQLIREAVTVDALLNDLLTALAAVDLS